MTGIVVLAGLLLSLAYTSFRDASRERDTRSRMVDLKQLVQEYHGEHERWPETIEELALEKPLDAWGNEILYIPYEPVLGYGAFWSAGRDGQYRATDGSDDIHVQFVRTEPAPAPPPRR